MPSPTQGVTLRANQYASSQLRFGRKRRIPFLLIPEHIRMHRRERFRRFMLFGVLSTLISGVYVGGGDWLDGRKWQAAWNHFTHKKGPDDVKRQKELKKYIQRTYLKSPLDVIHWDQFADIIEYVANHTDNDEDFRHDLWEVAVQEFRHRFDSQNKGLPRRFLNCKKDGTVIHQQEQMHHYVGGVTGSTELLPTHLFNRNIPNRVWEVKEYAQRGRFNHGDIAFFEAIRSHREDFLKKGRHTVAPNLRRLLSSSGGTSLGRR